MLEDSNLLQSLYSNFLTQNDIKKMNKQIKNYSENQSINQ